MHEEIWGVIGKLGSSDDLADASRIGGPDSNTKKYQTIVLNNIATCALKMGD